MGRYDQASDDEDVTTLAVKVLKARKGDASGYAALLIAHCADASELPPTIRGILEAVDKALAPSSATAAGQATGVGDLLA